MIVSINLLPYREERRKQKLNIILISWVATALVGAGLALLIHSLYLAHEEELFTQHGVNEATIANLDKKLGEIKDISERKKMILSKLEVIKVLDRHRNLPVHILDEVTQAVPDKIWLTKLVADNRVLKLDGYSMSESIVADFMLRLNASPYFSKVELTQVLQNALKDNNYKLFALSTHYAPLAETTPAEPTTKPTAGP